MSIIHDVTYSKLCNSILENGEKKSSRAGNTIGIFGAMAKFDLQKGFPLLTTKKMNFKAIVTELLWFISGSTNIKYLVDRGCNIWNKDAYRWYKTQYGGRLDYDEYVRGIKEDAEFAEQYGDLGFGTYGSMWRGFPNGSNAIDQLSRVLYKLEANPDDRRMIVTAWHPCFVDHIALPPCHVMFQFNTVTLTSVPGGRRMLNLAMYQRSCDTFLGVPFNIASYSLLLHLVAWHCDMIPGTFTHFYGDLHIYENHIDQIEEQISREPFPAPQVHIKTEHRNLFDVTENDIELFNYKHHDAIKGELSVG